MGYPFDTVQTLLIRIISNLVGFLKISRTPENLSMAAREVIGWPIGKHLLTPRLVACGVVSPCSRWDIASVRDPHSSGMAQYGLFA
jgi:hypothetical protein